MSGVKQVIILRKDLNMRKGKMVAQGAHASMAAVLSRAIDTSHYRDEVTIPLTDYSRNLTPLGEWLNGLFKKVCVSVDSEQELLDIYEKAKEAKLTVSLIQDSGLTEFGGVPTYTAVAIGPDYDQDIDPITSHLRLL